MTLRQPIQQAEAITRFLAVVGSQAVLFSTWRPCSRELIPSAL